jgi:microcystin-dependent protein
MSDPFLGEIKLAAFGFAPRGFALCNGQLLPINQNQALFALLGTTYGGNGQTTFALPNLQGRVPLHRGSGLLPGQTIGSNTHTLTASEIPLHTHALNASTANADSPVGATFVLAASNNGYGPASNVTSLHPNSVSTAGGSQPHLNAQPYLAVTYIIALQGIFPSQS